MKVRIRVAAPDRDTVDELPLEVGQSVLIGRAPDPLQIAQAAPDRAGDMIVPAVVDSKRVSANHALTWLEDAAVCLRDLSSRNGTWLRLPAAATVRVTPPTSIDLQLAMGAPAGQAGSSPADAHWSSPRAYGSAVMASIGTWLLAQGLGAGDFELRLLGQTNDRAVDVPGRFPLADQNTVEIVWSRTMDDRAGSVFQQLWSYVARQNQRFATEQASRDEGLLLASPPIRRTHFEVVNAATQGLRGLLLLGESGAGKEGLARAYHRHSGRGGAFVPLNCATLQKDLVRAELFGAEPGAYTGLTQTIVGAVEQANEGTLFLDEIGDMPLDIQPVLLRFLDDGVFERMGRYGKKRRADAHLVCATNKDLRAEVREGRFRADLWFRLSVQVVEVPPLRDRPEDVMGYLESRTLGGELSALAALASDAIDLVRRHTWQGNFRELANFVLRLPRCTMPASIDLAACRRALELGALSAVSPSPTAASSVAVTTDDGSDWAEVAAVALRAFEEDFQRAPSTWDDVKELNENYLKPVTFVHLTGATSHEPPRDHDETVRLAHRLAPKVRADRGTAIKQLRRYFERFGG